MSKQMHHNRLSPREMDVLQMLWDGMQLKEIAHVLGLSMSRVRGARQSSGYKLGVENSWKLCRKALELRLIELPKER
jgi:DNA-binding NarL/FixJ family response regulator